MCSFTETGKTVVLSVCSGIINNVWLVGGKAMQCKLGAASVWASRWAKLTKPTIPYLDVKVGQNCQITEPNGQGNLAALTI